MKSYCDFVINKNPECQPIPAKGLEWALSEIEPNADDKMVCQMTKHELRAAVRGLRLRLSDMTHERDLLRREVAALVIHTARLGCPRCAEFVRKCPVKKAEDYGKEACRTCWAAWAKQAAQAGKGDQ